MADFSLLKAHIDARIYENTSQAITGAALNETLQEMVDSVNDLKGDKIPYEKSNGLLPSGGMKPNVYYDLGTIVNSITLALADITELDKLNLYMFRFSVGSGTTISWDPKITHWLGSAPGISVGRVYEVIVNDGLGIWAEY